MSGSSDGSTRRASPVPPSQTRTSPRISPINVTGPLRTNRGGRSSRRSSRLSAASPYSSPAASHHEPVASTSAHTSPPNLPTSPSHEAPDPLPSPRRSSRLASHLEWRDRTYELAVVQQPLRAPAIGLALDVLDRLPIIPAPVVQLVVRDLHGVEIDPASLLEDLHHFFCSSSLLDAQNNDSPIDIVELDDSAVARDHRHLQMLVGANVADVRHVRDLAGRAVLYFVFGDISVRTAGKFKIRFALGQAVEGSRASLASTISDAFDAQNREEYVGGYEQAAVTELSRHLHSSGIRLYMPPLGDASLRTGVIPP